MPSITGAEDAIDAMLLEGRSFGEIETFISEQPISEELKSALWLWAWADQPLAAKRDRSSPGLARTRSRALSVVRG